MSISFTYFGHDTLTDIQVGDGRSAWQRWGLMDHEGPFFRLDHLGYPSVRYAYLPVDLLELLYERFRNANPSGVTYTAGDLFVHNFLKGRFTEEEQEAMYDRRKALFCIHVEESEKGYPHMRPYLPELGEPQVIQRLASDPWLDSSLLSMAEHMGAEKGGIPNNLWVDRSARWSPEWRAFCDGLSPQDWSPETGWKQLPR